MKEFTEYMEKHEILELQLVPSDNLEHLYLRVVRFQQGKTQVKPKEIMDKFCVYLMKGEQCKMVKDLRQTLLDGDNISGKETLFNTTQVVSQGNPKDVFLVDNYQIMFEEAQGEENKP